MGEFNTQVAIRKATDNPRASLIADIVGHPKQAPSVREINYMNTNLKPDKIRHHLGILQEVCVVTELVVEPGDRVRGYPYKFYTLTQDARELFEENNLFPMDAWRRAYEKVQKPAEIREIEEMPRPNDN